MRVTFPYVKEKSSVFGVVFRPVAKAIFEVEFPQWMYVDSGADISLIPLSVGKLIGFRREREEKLEKIFGVGRSSIPILTRRVLTRLGLL
jgi:hypothetical protein